MKQFQRTAKTLEDSQEDMHDRYRRRSEECDRLRDDVKHQAEELTTTQGRLRECQSTLSDTQGQLLPSQYELTKITREKDLLISQVNFLEGSQTERMNELITLRRSNTEKVTQLER